MAKKTLLASAVPVPAAERQALTPRTEVEQILDELEALGVTATPRGGRLVLKPKGKLTEAQLSRLKRNREAILDHLERREVLEPATQPAPAAPAETQRAKAPEPSAALRQFQKMGAFDGLPSSADGNKVIRELLNAGGPMDPRAAARSSHLGQSLPLRGTLSPLGLPVIPGKVTRTR